MGKNGLCILGLSVCFAALLIAQCTDATKTISQHKTRKHSRNSNRKSSRNFHFSKKINKDIPFDSNTPNSLPENTPTYCINPPSTALPPSTGPIPIGYTPPASSVPIFPGPTPIPPSSPNPSIIIPSPPVYVPMPTQPVLSPPSSPNPSIITPSPPIYVPPMPTQPVLSPPYYELSPPYNLPSVPSTPKFLPPIVYPPPRVPPSPPNQAPAMWCVAKASVPGPIIKEAMDYACGSGADCGPIQPTGLCFQPNTLFAHASYAFNSYWQRTKVVGGTCDFGGTAVLVTVDPSYGGCNFMN